MIYQEYLPAARLRPYIKCYWVMQKSFGDSDQERVLPESCFELMFQHQGHFALGSKKLPQLFIIGQLQKPLYLTATPQVTQFCARIWPWGIPPFGHLNQLEGKTIADATDVLLDGQKNLTARLRNATTDTVAAIYDDYFLAQLLKWRFTNDIIMAATEYMRIHRGVVRMSDVADFCFTSQRTLERSFNDYLQQAPHKIAMRVRFEHVRNSLIRQPHVPLAELAVRYGYSDQAHLAHDFKKCAGMSPSAFARDIQNMHFEDEPHVAFLQDDTE